MKPAIRWVFNAGSYLTLVVIVARHWGHTIMVGSGPKRACWTITVVAKTIWFKSIFTLEIICISTRLMRDDRLHDIRLPVIWRRCHWLWMIVLLGWVTLLVRLHCICLLAVQRRIHFLAVWIQWICSYSNY